MILYLILFLPVLAIADNNWVYTKHNTDLSSWKASTKYIYFDNAKNKEIESRLILGCTGKNPFIEIHSGKFLGTTGNKFPVMFTINSQKPFSEAWKIRSPYILYKKTSKRKIISFMLNINEKVTLKTRIEPFGSLPINFTFNLNGVDEVISKIKNDCPNKLKYWESKLKLHN